MLNYTLLMFASSSSHLSLIYGFQDEDTTLTTFDNVDSSGHDLSSKSMPTEQEKVKKKQKKNPPLFPLIMKFALLEYVILMTQP